jgi:HD-GYP domain-containing protein (c-di-GMP phosphodiesterase class II)
MTLLDQPELSTKSAAVNEPGLDLVPIADGQLRLAEVIGALSHALDITEGQPPGHCQRCCWIGFHIGCELRLTETELRELYYTLLLKDAGCSSNAERLCELYAHDDLRTKHDFAQVDTNSLKQLASFVLTHAAPGAGLGSRLSHVLNLMRHGEQLADELVMARCERGAQVARQLGFPDTVAAGIQSLDEHWDGRGRPQRHRSDDIPLGSRIALLAQVADVFYQVGGASAARNEVLRRSGSWFDPRVVDAFLRVAQEPGFWTVMAAEDFESRLCALEPSRQILDPTESRLDAIALAFAQIVDAKSHFTFGHSERVGNYAAILATSMGFSARRTAWVRRAGLLHDLGKLGVSNTILDKPGRLSADEWASVKRHPALTEEILARIGPFRELARVAGAHHERLDGCGYPRGLNDIDISLETRMITTADIFDALTAARPYRAALSIDEALIIMERERGRGIDSLCLDALVSAIAKFDIQAADSVSGA